MCRAPWGGLEGGLHPKGRLHGWHGVLGPLLNGAGGLGGFAGAGRGDWGVLGSTVRVWPPEEAGAGSGFPASGRACSRDEGSERRGPEAPFPSPRLSQPWPLPSLAACCCVCFNAGAKESSGVGAGSEWGAAGLGSRCVQGEGDPGAAGAAHPQLAPSGHRAPAHSIPDTLRGTKNAC